MDLAIDLQNISKTYRNGVKALAGLNMQVARGEIFGLLGPNGAGKSTLVKALLRLVHPTHCEGSMLGQPIGHVPTLKKIGYLPEHVLYAKHLTPVDLLDFSGRLTGVPASLRKARIPELLATVGMERWHKEPLANFSKGMKQRIGLAQALMNDPELIFLDEPTDGVDPLGRRDIRNLILGLRERGKTVFVNSHLLAELEMICDRVAILQQGKVLRQGPLKELTRHASRYEMVVEGDVFNRDSLVKLVRSLGGTLALTADGQQTVVAVPTSRSQVVQPVIDEIRSSGITILSLTPVHQTLEELFMDTVLMNGKITLPSAQPEAIPTR
jgi:ABC-2 type transport system ATP-binding protein